MYSAQDINAARKRKNQEKEGPQKSGSSTGGLWLHRQAHREERSY
jgi:hypothetical protein